LPTLVEYLLPLARLGGRVVAYKGSAVHEEVLASEKGIHLLGGCLRKLIPVEVPGLAETRVLVVIDKVAQTPDGYPRGRGLPRKQPLGGAPSAEVVDEIVEQAEES
jgi:16S rRNA (guanine527-N7)-methyltransferase